MITFPPQMRNAGVDEMALRSESQRCMNRLKMELGPLNTLTKRFVYNNGMEITCRYCFGKEDVWVKLPVVEVKAIEVVEETTYSVFLHPRIGDIELMTHYESMYVDAVGINVVVPVKSQYGVAGGFIDGKTQVFDKYIYPTADTDKQSYRLSGDDATSIAGKFLDADYGNLYWWNFDDENPVFVSWKGSPSRHFRMSNTIEIPGFSTQETTLPSADEDILLYAAFGHNIYSEGSVLLVAPKWNWPRSGPNRCFVLGAGVDTEGVLWSVMQSDRFNVPKYIYIFSDGYRIDTETESAKSEYLNGKSGVSVVFEKHYPDKKGIYTMLWKQGGPVDGWSLISEKNTGRQSLPWFADKDCQKFLSPTGDSVATNGLFTAASSDQVGSFTGSSASYSNTDTATYTENYSASASKTALHEPVVSGVDKGVVLLEFSSQTNMLGTYSKSRVYRGSYPLLYDPADPEQVPKPLAITEVQGNIVVGQRVTALTTGGQGYMRITTSGFAVDKDGYVTSVDNCLAPGQTRTGSVTVTDECGASATREVRISTGGVWITTGWTYFGCTGYLLQEGYPPCDSPLCENGNALNTSCYFAFTWNYGSGSTYYSHVEETASTRKTTLWGYFSGYSVYPTTVPGYYGGDRGSPTDKPPALTAIYDTAKLYPVYQAAEKWVCP